MAPEVIIRKWGNSLGVVLPKDYVEQRKLKEDDTVYIEIAKPVDLRHLFGTLKTKMTGQQFKDMVRKGSL